LRVGLRLPSVTVIDPLARSARDIETGRPKSDATSSHQVLCALRIASPSVVQIPQNHIIHVLASTSAASLLQRAVG
jgi:hypothetical protein